MSRDELLPIKWALLVLIILQIADLVMGQERTHTPADAVKWALTDVLSIPEQDRAAQRYVWMPPHATPDWIPAFTVALNMSASQSPIIYRPALVPPANGWLLRVDLRRLASDPKKLAKLIETWDGLSADEPYWRVPKVNLTGDADNVALLAPHIGDLHADLLKKFSYSPSLVYRADWLMNRLLRTHYYEFRQLVAQSTSVSVASKGETAPKTSPVASSSAGGLLTQQQALARLGIDEAKSKALNGDIRKATLQSQITGQQRRVDCFQGLAGRYNSGRVWITHDPAQDDVDPNKLPMASLLAFNDTGREIISELPNGFHEYLIANNRGELLREVPANVATDRTVPAPHPARLETAISCVRCHGPSGGLIPITDDVSKLLRRGVDVLDDTDGVTREKSLERLAGLYGDPSLFDRKLARSRDDLSAAVFTATSGFFSKGEAKDNVARCYDSVSKMHDGYAFSLVTPQQACLELGWEVEAEKATEHLNAILGGPQGEDVIVASLRAGLSVRRPDWERVYFDAATRAARFQGGETKKAPQPNEDEGPVGSDTQKSVMPKDTPKGESDQ